MNEKFGGAEDEMHDDAEEDDKKKETVWSSQKHSYMMLKIRIRRKGQCGVARNSVACRLMINMTVMLRKPISSMVEHCAIAQRCGFKSLIG